jgi:hypothetical protein
VKIRLVWVRGTSLGIMPVAIDPPLADDEVEIAADDPEPPRTVTPTIDAVALADLLARSTAP